MQMFFSESPGELAEYVVGRVEVRRSSQEFRAVEQFVFLGLSPQTYCRECVEKSPNIDAWVVSVDNDYFKHTFEFDIRRCVRFLFAPVLWKLNMARLLNLNSKLYRRRP